MQISFQYTAFIWHILHNQCIYTISCQSHKWKQKQQQQNFIESHGKNTSISVLALGFKIMAKDLGPRWYTDSFGSWNKLNKTSFRDLEKIYFWIMWNTLYHIFYKKKWFWAWNSENMYLSSRSATTLQMNAKNFDQFT